jgi:hypothetical protein
MQELTIIRQAVVTLKEFAGKLEGLGARHAQNLESGRSEHGIDCIGGSALLLEHCLAARTMLVPRIQSLLIFKNTMNGLKDSMWDMIDSQSKKIYGETRKGSAQRDLNRRRMNPLARGKMHINELWNAKLNSQVTVASNLLDLQRVMDSYKRNTKAVKQIHVDEKLTDELETHLSTLNQFIQTIKDDEERLDQPEIGSRRHRAPIMEVKKRSQGNSSARKGVKRALPGQTRSSFTQKAVIEIKSPKTNPWQIEVHQP